MNIKLKDFIIHTLIVIGIVGIILLSIIKFDSLIVMWHKVISILLPFIYGLVMAYLLSPLCNKIKTKLKKQAEFKSVMITEIVFIIILILVGSLIIPQAIVSIRDIITSTPYALEQTQNWIDIQIKENNTLKELVGNRLDNIESVIKELIYNYIVPNFETLATSVVISIKEIARFITNIIFGIIISIFALSYRHQFKRQSKSVIYAIFKKNTSDKIIEEISVANEMFSKFFLGKVIDSLIVGVVCFIIISLLNIPYALLVSVIVGITNMIPIVGPFIGAIPSIIIILSVEPVKAIYFTIFIILLQQIDGHIIGPKCIGNATGLNTFWVLFGIIFFGGIWGIAGMFIGVPLTAVIYDIIKKVVNKKLSDKGIHVE